MDKNQEKNSGELPQELEVRTRKFLTFNIAKEEYGIDIQFVEEIIGIQVITDLPEMPTYIKGIINLRGKIIPVLDVRLRFGMPENPYNDRTCIIVTRFSDLTIGFVVDSVLEVLDIPIDDIEPPIKIKSGSGGRYIFGLGKVENKVKILLDLSKLLYDDDIAILSEVAS